MLYKTKLQNFQLSYVRIHLKTSKPLLALSVLLIAFRPLSFQSLINKFPTLVQNGSQIGQSTKLSICLVHFENKMMTQQKLLYSVLII